MQYKAGISLTWMGAMALPIALVGCATPPSQTSCAPLPGPSPHVLGQSEVRGYNDGYRAGELAQALLDQARARQNVAAQSVAAATPTATPLADAAAATLQAVPAAGPTKNAAPPAPPNPATPPATSHNNFAISGPPIPLSNIPSPF